jgi:hypothetical protein
MFKIIDFGIERLFCVDFFFNLLLLTIATKNKNKGASPLAE